MDPDRSSRVAARRIVEEVLADHAARATALDGAKPVTIVERPDTPSWRAARRIVEETLAEHAARAVVPPAMRLDVVVDLEKQDVEVVVDLDGHEPDTELGSGQVTTADSPPDPADPAAVNVVVPIERDETPAKAARRVVEGVLTEHEIDPDAPTDADDAPMAFEIDPVPEAVPEPPEPVTTRVAAAPEPPETDRDDPDGQDLRVDDARLREAIPERLFEPEPEPEPAPEPEPTDADTALAEPPVLDESGVGSSADGPPPPHAVEAVPAERLDPDAPVAIAARIVAGVLADREHAAQEARDAQEAREARDAQVAREARDAQVAREARDAQEARDAELAALEAEPSGSEPSGQAGTPAPDAESGTGPVASEDSESQPSGVPEGWAVVPSASERGGAGSPSGVMIVDAGVEDLALDPVSSDPRVDDRPAPETDELWTRQEAVDPAAQDEFGAWPDPIVPPRRTGRWLITTVLGALLLALLLPLAIGALRDLVSFS